MAASHIKKEQYKNDITDINTYKQKIFNEKKGLMDKQIKMEKILAFLPNSQLSANQYQQVRQTPDEIVGSFKKKYNFLNFINES